MKPLVLVPQRFGSLVFDRRTSRYLPFDHDGTRLLRSALDRPLSFRPDEAPFVEDFYALGFFTPDLRFAGTCLDLEPPADHLTGPLAVHLEVVAACNLTCTHCFAGALPRREEALSLAELDALFATFARIGSFRLGLTGGEPLLRKDLLEIVDAATGHGLAPCLTTNGLLVTEAIARELGRRELVWLNVSLDGASPETNDPVRGAGTFDRVVERLALLGRHARFSLAFTITRRNAHEVGACALLAERLGAHVAVFRPLYPVGVARHHLDLMPSFEQYARALRELEDMGARSVEPFGPATRAEQKAQVYQNHGCGAGNTVCSISLGGDVNPCSFLGRGFDAANVRRVPFEEIWHRSQTFRAIRAMPGGFAGGCRARSLVLAGDASAPDPWLVEHQARGGPHPLVVLHDG